MPALALVLALVAADPQVSPEVRAKLQPAFDGTLVSVYDDGRKGHLNLAADGTYKYRGRRNDPSDGVWRLKGANICLYQKHPIPFGHYCTPIPHGETWRTKAAGGEMVTIHVENAKG